MPDSAYLPASESEGVPVITDDVGAMATSPEPQPPKASSVDKFPVVSLGGSAGSLEALERFFLHMPPTNGVAFVVVTHLLDDQESELPAILRRFTQMVVHAATDGLKIRPNQVYVMPPDKDMSVLHGTLWLLTPTQPPGRRLPIDYFWQSLAKDARERAVCIVLSGLGTDGTVGLKMVMENFGMVMVQQPETASYDAMPRAAIATEFVDFILPAEELPAQLLDYVRLPAAGRRPRDPLEATNGRPAHALQKIFTLIRAQTGHDFSYYKRNTVFRRIERRMNSHQIKEFGHYVRYLQENPREVEQLFKELLIGVTKFFRDPEAYQGLKNHLLPLLSSKAPDSTIRVWAPGCSTGEEAYSLAMTLLECLDLVEADKYLKIQIFATDINAEGIDYARNGLYSENITADVSPERLQRFFVKVDGAYQIRKQVRDVVVFALHNVNKDAPFTRLDLLCCRNLLIYLNGELQKNLLPVFHYALNPNGVLFLGPSENLTGFQDLFTPLDLKWKISRRTEGPASVTRLLNFSFALSPHNAAASVAASTMSNPASRRNGLATLVQKELLRAYAPPAVVINSKGEILYINGRTGRYLEPAPGLSGMNIFDMAREDLNFELGVAVHKATQQREDVMVENVQVKTEVGIQRLRLCVRYLTEPEVLAGLLLVAFEDQPTPRRVRTGKASGGAELTRDAVVMALDKELQYTKHRLQTTIEEMESSLEELKSTNEELQSANEELQSTNEEAMTNKEEMQSLNEELMTLNMQYLSKTEELSQAANDMKNLLDSTEIATIFLGNDMVIKRFTSSVGHIINLLPTDVGRPITHFASNLRYEHLAQDVQLVLDRLLSIETNIQTTTDEWYAVRVMPYRTLDNYIDGAVLTFTQITSLKKMEEQLQESTRFAESIVKATQEPLLALDQDLRVLMASDSLADLFGIAVEEVKGQPLTKLGGVWRQPVLLLHLRELVDKGVPFDDIVLEARFPKIGQRRLLLYGRRLQKQTQQANRVLLGIKFNPDEIL